MVHRPSSKFTLQSDDLSPEAVALFLELGEALTKSAILHERLGRPSGVDQSGRSLALSGAVGAHPLGVGRPLPRPARLPLWVVHATTMTTRRHGSLPASIPMVTDHVTDHYPSTPRRALPSAPIGTQGRTRSASSASAPKRTISSRLSRSASKISIVVALPSLTQIAFGGGPCRNELAEVGVLRHDHEIVLAGIRPDLGVGCRVEPDLGDVLARWVLDREHRNETP
jgi:hypothetical protein